MDRLSLSDWEHPAVAAQAAGLASDRPAPMDRLEAIFEFVRDEIAFGFPPVWDRVKASETLDYGVGYCNTKATLFHALCRAAGISSRVHTGLIRIEIMRGVFPSFAFPFLPSLGAHSWVEVEIGGQWRPIDSYINDRRFYQGALRCLLASGRSTAYSLAGAQGDTSCEFNFGEKGFVHMAAVAEDQGPWDDLSEYLASDRYRPLGRLQRSAYPLLARMSNRNIERIRAPRP